LTPETIKKLAEEIVNQSFLGHWGMYALIILLVFVIGYLSSYFTSYATKRGLDQATEDGFSKLKRQIEETTRITEGIKTEILQASTKNIESIKAEILKETTKTTESIKADMQRLLTRSHAVEERKREKLEEYLTISYRFPMLLLNNFNSKILKTNDKHDHMSVDLLMRLTMLQALYLPELDTAHKQIADSTTALLNFTNDAVKDPRTSEIKHKEESQELFSKNLDSLYMALRTATDSAKIIVGDLNNIQFSTSPSI
jgi:septal ring factor EnvC (AmiA/AmiB activator)